MSGITGNQIRVSYGGIMMGMKVGEFDRVVDLMVRSLHEAVEREGVSEDEVREVLASRALSGLDDIFNDGGFVRCEEFTDLGIEFALAYGELESEGFDEAHWELIDEAIDRF